MNLKKSKNIQLLFQNARDGVDIRSLISLNESFIKYLLKNIKDFVQISPRVSLLSTKIKTFSEIKSDIKSEKFFSSLSSNSSKNLENGFFIIDRSFFYTFLDLLLGAANNTNEVEVKGRRFTNIEYNFIRRFLSIFLNAYNTSLSDIGVPLEISTDSLDISFSNSVANEDECYFVNKLELVINNNVAEVDIALPYSLYNDHKEVLKKVRNIEGNKDSAGLQYFEDLIYTLDVQVCVEHSEKMYNFKEIADLTVGSTIMLSKYEEENWDITVNKAKVSSGKLGKVKNRVAVEIKEELDSLKYLI